MNIPVAIGLTSVAFAIVGPEPRENPKTWDASSSIHWDCNGPQIQQRMLRAGRLLWLEVVVFEAGVVPLDLSPERTQRPRMPP
jgi:hypothetical protein